MGGLGKKLGGEEVKPSPVPEPEALPVTDDDAGAFEQKQAVKSSGYEKTIMTGNLTPKSTGKKRVLG